MEWLRSWIGQRRRKRELYGEPCSLASYPIWQLCDRLQHGELGIYIARSRRIQGWTRDSEAVALAQFSYALADNPVIVEIGSFLGSSTVLLAGARKVRGSGQVYCVDPFDATGEPFSMPIYQRITGTLGQPLRQCFEQNIRWAGIDQYVHILQGKAHEVAATWNQAVDLLFLDGDQSYQGVRLAYERWAPFLRPNSCIAVHNSHNGSYPPDHDGHRRLVQEQIQPPHYREIICIGTTTFARRWSA